MRGGGVAVFGPGIVGEAAFLHFLGEFGLGVAGESGRRGGEERVRGGLAGRGGGGGFIDNGGRLVFSGVGFPRGEGGEVAAESGEVECAASIQQNVSGQIKRTGKADRHTFAPGREGLCGGEEGVMGRVMTCRRLARCVSTGRSRGPASSPEKRDLKGLAILFCHCV